MADSAVERAGAAESEWTRRRRRAETLAAPLLLGVPVSVKDTVDVAGVPTTMGSLLTSGAPAAADELFVEQLRGGGGADWEDEHRRVRARCTDDESTGRSVRESMGSNAYGRRVEWRGGGRLRDRSGTAAPRHGRRRVGQDSSSVLRRRRTEADGQTGARRMRGAGLSQFEVDGALARTVADAAILLSAMVGTDARDPTQYPGDPPDFASWAVAGDLRGLTLSASPALAATAVAAGMQRAVDALRHAGAAVTDEAPLTPEPSALLSTVTAAGAALDYGELAAQRTHDLSDLCTPQLDARCRADRNRGCGGLRRDQPVRVDDGVVL